MLRTFAPQIDNTMMDHLIEGFPAQLEEALAIGRAARLRPLSGPVRHILATGLGGSGIGADFVAAFIQDECKLPFLVRKGYHIPAFAGPETLAIASSYSGQTEETLMAYDQLSRQGARIICITSGGQLLQKAQADDVDCIALPGGYPSPRACLGYSLTAQLALLHRLGLTGEAPLRSIASSIALLQRESESIRTEARAVAHELVGKTAVIYTEDRLEPVAVRLRQQLNENSKVLCWHHVIPEMNHNELVGWRDRRDDLAVVYLRTDREYSRNTLRMKINQEIIGDLTPTILNLRAKGETLVEQAIYLVHLGDWISWYLAQARGQDALEINVIDHLKRELGKVPR